MWRSEVDGAVDKRRRQPRALASRILFESAVPLEPGFDLLYSKYRLGSMESLQMLDVHPLPCCYGLLLLYSSYTAIHTLQTSMRGEKRRVCHMQMGGYHRDDEMTKSNRPDAALSYRRAVHSAKPNSEQWQRWSKIPNM